jgi:hypothetical protein
VTPQQHLIIAKALEEALAQQVCKLFSVLVSAPADDAEAMMRFLKGIDKAVAAYAEAVNEVLSV